MLPATRLVPILCAASGLMAQSVGDINSLILQASRYAAHEAAERAPHRELTLYRVIGTCGGEDALMHAGVDVQQWRLVYQIESPAAPPPALAGEIAQSLTVPCTRGMFGDLLWSPLPVFDAKSLQWIWIAIGLDQAIARLNQEGYTRGFCNLTIFRPLHPRYPDECTFVFKCPLDGAFVGISGQTGKKLWTEPFPC